MIVTCTRLEKNEKSEQEDTDLYSAFQALGIKGGGTTVVPLMRTLMINRLLMSSILCAKKKQQQVKPKTTLKPKNQSIGRLYYGSP